MLHLRTGVGSALPLENVLAGEARIIACFHIFVKLRVSFVSKTEAGLEQILSNVQLKFRGKTALLQEVQHNNES